MSDKPASVTRDICQRDPYKPSSGNVKLLQFFRDPIYYSPPRQMDPRKCSALVCFIGHVKLPCADKVNELSSIAVGGNFIRCTDEIKPTLS